MFSSLHTCFPHPLGVSITVYVIPSPHGRFPKTKLVTLTPHVFPSPHTCFHHPTDVFLTSHVFPSPHTCFHHPTDVFLFPHVFPSPTRVFYKHTCFPQPQMFTSPLTCALTPDVSSSHLMFLLRSSCVLLTLTCAPHPSRVSITPHVSMSPITCLPQPTRVVHFYPISLGFYPRLTITKMATTAFWAYVRVQLGVHKRVCVYMCVREGVCVCVSTLVFVRTGRPSLYWFPFPPPVRVNPLPHPARG